MMVNTINWHAYDGISNHLVAIWWYLLSIGSNTMVFTINWHRYDGKYNQFASIQQYVPLIGINRTVFGCGQNIDTNWHQHNGICHPLGGGDRRPKYLAHRRRPLEKESRSLDPLRKLKIQKMTPRGGHFFKENDPSRGSKKKEKRIFFKKICTDFGLLV